MDALRRLPELGDAQLARLVESVLAARCRAEMAQTAHILARIDATSAEIGVLLEPLFRAYKTGMESAANVMALWEETAALNTAIFRHGVEDRQQRLLERCRERTQRLLEDEMSPILLRLRGAYITEIAEAKAKLSALLARLPASMTQGTAAVAPPARRPVDIVTDALIR
ncbi:MAG TPA: hypothetical protein PLN91_00560 [Rhodanobacteraceae bacterium]|nr:hypothetical protein [Rhodanobacteraceae bacterium]